MRDIFISPPGGRPRGPRGTALPLIEGSRSYSPFAFLWPNRRAVGRSASREPAAVLASDAPHEYISCNIIVRMSDDIICEKAIEILNPGRLYFAIKAMRKSPVKISFDMGDLNLTSGAVSSLISIEGKLPEEVQHMEWLVLPGGSEDPGGSDPAGYILLGEPGAGAGVAVRSGCSTAPLTK